MPKKIIVGHPFAYGFYSPALHVTRPASTYAFSRLIKTPTVGYVCLARTVNILWRGATMEILDPFVLSDPEKKAIAEARQRADIEAVQRVVEAKHADATFRGLFTSTNILIAQKVGPLRVAGPAVRLEDFIDGPIFRPDRRVRIVYDRDVPLE